MIEVNKKHKSVEEFVEYSYNEAININEPLKFTLRFFEERMGVNDIFPFATIPREGPREAEYTIQWIEDINIYQITCDFAGYNGYKSLAAEDNTLKLAIQRAVNGHGRAWLSKNEYREPTAEEQVKAQLKEMWTRERRLK